MTHLHVGFSHLKEHKFRHNFQGTILIFFVLAELVKLKMLSTTYYDALTMPKNVYYFSMTLKVCLSLFYIILESIFVISCNMVP